MTNNTRTRVLTFRGTSQEFAEYLAYFGDYCLLNPGMTIGEFAEWVDSEWVG